VPEFRDIAKLIAFFLQNHTSYENFISRFETTGLKSETGHIYHSGYKIGKKLSRTKLIVYNKTKHRFLTNVGLVSVVPEEKC